MELDQPPVNQGSSESSVVSSPTPVGLPTPQPIMGKGIMMSLVILVIILVGASSYLFMQNQKLLSKTNVSVSPSPAISAVPAASVDPTASWQTYLNTKANFSLKYPRDVQAIDSGVRMASDMEATATSNNVNFIYQPNLEVAAKELVIIIYPSILDADKGKLNEKKTIGNSIADCWSTVDKEVSYCWLKNPSMNNYLNIVITNYTDATAKNLYDQILSTFQFTDAIATKTTGVVSGKLCYPSEGLPPGEIVAKNTKTGVTQQQVVNASSSIDYSFQLPEGNYHLRYQAHPSAVKPETFTSLYYTMCVKNDPYGSCGPSDDHTMLIAAVSSGSETKNINLCDYGSSPQIEQSLNSSF